jgi:CHAD domain-containing protein
MGSAFKDSPSRRRTVIHSLRDATLNLLDSAIETLTSSRSDEAVHASRKASKRIRAALRLMRESLGPRAYRRENERVRDGARPLTAVRDAFMLRQCLRTVPVRSLALHRRLDAEYHRERNALESRGARTAVARFRTTRAELVDTAMDSQVASAIAGVRKIYKAGRNACAQAQSRDDQALHELRKQTKYLLNQFELLHTVFNVKFKTLHRRAEQLADILGDDHDLGVLLSKVRRYDAANRRLAKHVLKRRHKLQAQALRLAEKLYRRSAKCIGTVIAETFDVDRLPFSYGGTHDR